MERGTVQNMMFILTIIIPPEPPHFSLLQPVDTTLNLVNTRLNKHSCPKSSSVLTELNILCYDSDGSTIEIDEDLMLKSCKPSDSTANTNSTDDSNVAGSSNGLTGSKDTTSVHENTGVEFGQDAVHQYLAEHVSGYVSDQGLAGTGAVPSPHKGMITMVSLTDNSYVTAPITLDEEQTSTEDVATSELLYTPVVSASDHHTAGNCYNSDGSYVQNNTTQKIFDHSCTLSVSEDGIMSPGYLQMGFDLPQNGCYSGSSNIELFGYSPSPLSLSPVDESSFSCSYTTQDSCNHATEFCFSNPMAIDHSVMPTAINEGCTCTMVSDEELCTDNYAHNSIQQCNVNSRGYTSEPLLSQPTKPTQPDAQQCHISSTGYLTSVPIVQSSKLPINDETRRETQCGGEPGVINDVSDTVNSISPLPIDISCDTLPSSLSVSKPLGC